MALRGFQMSLVLSATSHCRGADSIPYTSFLSTLARLTNMAGEIVGQTCMSTMFLGHKTLLTG